MRTPCETHSWSWCLPLTTEGAGFLFYLKWKLLKEGKLLRGNLLSLRSKLILVVHLFIFTLGKRA